MIHSWMCLHCLNHSLVDVDALSEVDVLVDADALSDVDVLVESETLVLDDSLTR